MVEPDHTKFSTCQPGDLDSKEGPLAGTSLATPLWAGFNALMNERRQQTPGQGPLGFLNPSLYEIGKDSTRYAASFFDVKEGESNASCDGIVHKAATGYDLITGWGAPQCGLIEDLAGVPPPPTPTVSVRATRSQLADAVVQVCGDGSGFTPNSTYTLLFSGIPGDVPTFQTGGTSDDSGNIQYFINGFQLPSGITCQTGQFNLQVGVIVTDDVSGVPAAPVTFPGNYFCTNETVPRDFNGGCP